MGIARLTVAYDGTDFRGFAESTGVRTVMEPRATIERVVRVPIQPLGAGRTDAGVHGWGQVVSFELADDVDLGRLQRSCNRMLGPEIAVRSAQVGGAGFRRPVQRHLAGATAITSGTIRYRTRCGRGPVGTCRRRSTSPR